MRTNHFYIFTIIIALIITSLINTQITRAQSTCINLSYDLFSGLNDSSTDHSIITLQNYLKSLGYLAAVPNGHFGQSTLSAVKIFQTLHSISNTGRVGPLTRSALKQASCNTSNGSISVKPTITSSNNSNQSSPTSLDITSPVSGDRLTIGTNTTVRWSTNPGYMYNLLLEYPGGAGAGFVSGNMTSGNTYDWKVGKVYSSASNSYENVATGTYRIRLAKTGAGVSNGDLLSGWFTLTAPPFSIISVTPSSIPHDGKTVIAIYGQNFDTSSIVHLDGEFGQVINKLYTSTDGTFILCTVPNNISVGYHTLVVVDSYGTVSNSLNLFVTQ